MNKGTDRCTPPFNVYTPPQIRLASAAARLIVSLTNAQIHPPKKVAPGAILSTTNEPTTTSTTSPQWTYNHLQKAYQGLHSAT